MAAANCPAIGYRRQIVGLCSQNVRYVQVVGKQAWQDNFGTYRMQLAEVEVAGGNLAAGRPVSASSSSEFTAEGWLRSNLTDGSHQSRLWNSMGWTSESVRATSSAVGAGGPRRAGLISKVDLYARSDGGNTGNGFPVDYVIETSLDGTTLSRWPAVTDVPQPGAGVRTFTFPRPLPATPGPRDRTAAGR